MTTDRPPGSEPAAHRPRLVDEDLFRFLVDLEVEKASRLQYCVSVVCLTSNQTDEAPERVDPTFAARAAAAVTGGVRATDVITARPPGSLCVLLVDAETQDLPRIFERTTAELKAQASAGGASRPCVWSAGGSCYPRTAMSGAELLRQANDLTVRARQERPGALRLAT